MSIKIRTSVWLPALLSVYLLVIVLCFGLDHLRAGKYVWFFGVLIGGMILIALLYYVLRRKEIRKEQDDDAQYGTYADHPIEGDNNATSKTNNQ